MKKLTTFIVLITLAVLLSGCATLFRNKAVDIPKIEIAKNQWIKLPTPRQLDLNRTATQILTAEYQIKDKIQTYTSQVQVETTPEKLVLVAIAGWGGEIFSIDYDGTKIKTSSLPMPNAALGITHVLSDFIFTYASSDLLKVILKPTKIRLTIKNRERILTLDNKPIMKIHYQYKNPWKGKVTLRNLALHYTIKITTL